MPVQASCQGPCLPGALKIQQGLGYQKQLVDLVTGDWTCAVLQVLRGEGSPPTAQRAALGAELAAWLKVAAGLTVLLCC